MINHIFQNVIGFSCPPFTIWRNFWPKGLLREINDMIFISASSFGKMPGFVNHVENIKMLIKMFIKIAIHKIEYFPISDGIFDIVDE